MIAHLSNDINNRFSCTSPVLHNFNKFYWLHESSNATFCWISVCHIWYPHALNLGQSNYVVSNGLLKFYGNGKACSYLRGRNFNIQNAIHLRNVIILLVILSCNLIWMSFLTVFVECELWAAIVDTIAKIIYCVVLVVPGICGNVSVQVLSSGKTNTRQRWKERQLQWLRYF